MSASIIKKYAINANGILDIREEGIGIELADIGEWIDFKDLLRELDGRDITMSISCCEDCISKIQ